MQRKLSWQAIAVGVLVFVAWVGLDGRYPLLMPRVSSFNPEKTFGAGSLQAWIFIAVRIIGSSVVVPPLEEVFYRSFLYRYLIRSDFLSIPLHHFQWRAFIMIALVFGFGHFEWLPGILCAIAYQGLVCKKDRLGDAIVAHSITNLLLGVWVIFFKDYQFW
jgi:CAAX prenyl protease-like protein